jgi:peptide/nickel transport system substrate-binding protein
MKKKIVWVVVSCLMVVAMVLASCGKAVTEEEVVTPTEEEVVTPTEEEVVTPTEEEVVTPTEEVPKYGGWLHLALESSTMSLDDAFQSRLMAPTMMLTHESVVTGDWSKGPAGTGEYDLLYRAFLPDRVPVLIESWEFPDPDTIIMHVKKGKDAVHWALNPDSEASRLVGGREIVAKDIALSITRQFTLSTGYGYRQYINWWKPGGSATATDNYTVVIRGHDYPEGTAKVWEVISDWFYILPYEVIERYGDMQDWRNSVGTGPFMLTDFLAASYATLVRNPNYWQKDPCGAGKGNQLPYVDGVNLTVVLDTSTRLAALRTGKIDVLRGALIEDSKSLLNANPELQYARYQSSPYKIAFKVDEGPPFDDINVRRALHMAVNLQAIKDTYYGGEAELIHWPSTPMAGFMDAYTPLEELPESTRELFEYNPEKAEQLLDEAGYPGPDRFTFPCLCSSEAEVDLLSIAKTDLAKIGVTMNIDVRASAVASTMLTARTFKKAAVQGRAVNMVPMEVIGIGCGRGDNIIGNCDQYIDDLRTTIWAWENIGKDDVRMAAKKAVHEYALAQAYLIQFPLPYVYTLWWPWVKNYHGETGAAYAAAIDFVKHIWIDQDLRKEMTGRR